MKKIIEKQQFDAILNLLVQRDCTVKEYQAVVQLWEKAPEQKDETNKTNEEDKRPDTKGTEEPK